MWTKISYVGRTFHLLFAGKKRWSDVGKFVNIFGLERIMIDEEATINGSFVQAGLVDEVGLIVGCKWQHGNAGTFQSEKNAIGYDSCYVYFKRRKGVGR